MNKMIKIIKSTLKFLVDYFKSVLDGEDVYLDINGMNELVEENCALKVEAENYEQTISKLQSENNELIKGLEVINEELEIDRKAEYWNSKWTKGNVTYKAREDKIYFDVRNFITVPDCVLKNVIYANKLLCESHEDTVYRIMCWVQDNVKYVTDSDQFGFKEHWDFAAEVLKRKQADCEGMTNLIVSMCIEAGVPPYRIKNCCGNVKYKNGTVAGGHSYPIFLRDDDEWVDLDPCFYNTKNLVTERKPVKDNNIYSTIWFTFNNEYAFTNSDLEIKPGEEPNEI